ncbi:methyltransferase domain-containing protein [Roseivivax isoporae]|nr:methyltransferase domain-containing protein [Roseivivax isoporae]
MSHSFEGRCPVCEAETRFESPDDWLRDHLRCVSCGSIPRERAFAWCLDRYRPGWRDEVVHECSPGGTRLSERLRTGCPDYVASQYWPDRAPGSVHEGVRCENLEKLTFEDRSVDLHCHLDVLEHVNSPEACFAEMERTLRPGGAMLFTTPVYAEIAETARTAYYDDKGVCHFLGAAEYHGNPIDDAGSPVTFHYGRNLAFLVTLWTRSCRVQQIALCAPDLGVVGDFCDVFLVEKDAA